MSFLDKYFKITERNSNVKTEIIAGVTTFMTMAYIIIVNPGILSAAGMDFKAVFRGHVPRGGDFDLPDGCYR